MTKGSSYFQGLYLDMNFLISENVNFGADILVNIFFIIVWIFLHILSLCLTNRKIKAYDHFFEILLKYFDIK